ncbi:LacI family DNA-binding transcriptional regulator [Rhizobium tumorigenes]|uniref:LacI family DNA-binding transcriptional regulator n=1 Tax=Rhizobium tumorigenes TaxID=2041385 RepID=A0AAF1KWT2_9HYPH|nr:LacI family DNA-binding transcriptional regulator [Rhizobium tumorigenes]WFR97884.1 LacI family DNA-binding transcriptional regulator [Rhizobium tumorigenes]
MAPPFPLKDIALQSGLSLATVDRALHGRAHVAHATALKIEAAMVELERQYADSCIGGRRLVIDVVMETPQRFSNAVRAAFEAELPGMRPASLSTRFHVAETMEERDLLAILNRIRRRGSHGVVVKVPSTPAIAHMASELMASGIPVVTLVTDLPVPARQGYVGMDNRVAGATAAYMVARMAGQATGKVLLTLSSARFSGEEERHRSFRDALHKDAPHLGITTISEGFGVDRTTERLVKAALVADNEIRAVYSIGGGNRAILKAFAEDRRRIDVFAAHDLDADNRSLLTQGLLTFVIHHDLRQDARSACQMVMAHHRMLPRDFQVAPSRVAIATPYEVF